MKDLAPQQLVINTDTTQYSETIKMATGEAPDYLTLVLNVNPYVAGALDVTLQYSPDGVNWYDLEDVDSMYSDPETIEGQANIMLVIPNIHPRMRLAFESSGGADMTLFYYVFGSKGGVNTALKTEETVMSTIDSYLQADGGGAGKKVKEIQIVNGATAQYVALYDVDAEANISSSGELKRLLYLEANQPGYIKYDDPKVFTKGVLIAATSGPNALPASYAAGADLAFAMIEVTS